MTTLYASILFTIGASALCSLLEAMILSTTPTDIETLKQRSTKVGKLLEKYKMDIEETSSAILSLNTIANTAGATIAGAIFVGVVGEGKSAYFAAFMTVSILVLSEIIPKNVGVIYRTALLPYMIYPLAAVRFMMWPISRMASVGVRFLTRGKSAESETSDEDIILMAKKSQEEGEITRDEHDLISNALSLDTVSIDEVMTPRTVVTALDQSLTVGEIFAEYRNIPFARLPIYEGNIDTVTGYVRRRDLLGAMANDEHQRPVVDLKLDILVLSENAVASDALQEFLRSHQQIAVAVDEFGSVSGVVTMEDIIEELLGREIWEDDDVAIDMREFAKRQHKAAQRAKQRPAS